MSSLEAVRSANSALDASITYFDREDAEALLVALIDHWAELQAPDCADETLIAEIREITKTLEKLGSDSALLTQLELVATSTRKQQQIIIERHPYGHLSESRLEANGGDIVASDWCAELSTVQLELLAIGNAYIATVRRLSTLHYLLDIPRFESLCMEIRRAELVALAFSTKVDDARQMDAWLKDADLKRMVITQRSPVHGITYLEEIATALAIAGKQPSGEIQSVIDLHEALALR